MKFAFIYRANPELISPQFTYADNGDTTVFCRVKDVEQACKVVNVLVEEGYNLIELCGAFSEDDANEVAKASNDKASIGYVTRNEAQQKKFNELFM